MFNPLCFSNRIRKYTNCIVADFDILDSPVSRTRSVAADLMESSEEPYRAHGVFEEPNTRHGENCALEDKK